MLDSEALKSLIAHLSIKTMHSDMTDLPVAIIPEGMKIESLERFNNKPARRRAHLRMFRIDDFALYVNDHKTDATVVFVDPADACAVAIIDYGTQTDPLWRDHLVTVDVPKTAEANAVQGIIGIPITQSTLIEFLEDWPEMLTPIASGGESVGIPQAISAIRSVKLDQLVEVTSSVGDFESSASILDKVSARGVNQHLPTTIRATFQMIDGIDPVQIELRVSVVLEKADTPRFKLRAVGYAAIVDETIKSIERVIRSKLGAVPVYIGRA